MSFTPLLSAPEGVFRHLLGRRVVDGLAALHAGRARVDLHDEGRPWRRGQEPLGHSLIPLEAAAAVVADGEEPQLIPFRHELRRRDAHHRPQAGLGVAGIEGESEGDGELRDAPDPLDGGEGLVDVGHRLDVQEIDAALFEGLRLLGERLPDLGDGDLLHDEQLAAGAQRARYGDRVAGGLSGDLSGPHVDLPHLVAEAVLGEAEPVPVEAVRLDDLRAGVDVLAMASQNDIGREEVEPLRDVGGGFAHL